MHSSYSRSESLENVGGSWQKSNKKWYWWRRCSQKGEYFYIHNLSIALILLISLQIRQDFEKFVRHVSWNVTSSAIIQVNKIDNMLSSHNALLQYFILIFVLYICFIFIYALFYIHISITQFFINCISFVSNNNTMKNNKKATFRHLWQSYTVSFIQ